MAGTLTELGQSIDAGNTALKLFFSNHFTEAKDLMKPLSDTSMYYSLGYGTILFIQAVMTFDPADIEVAIAAVKQSVHVSHRFRKRTSFFGALSKIASGSNYDEYTEVELHAELIHGESMLIRALITFIQDDNLMSFVKGGLKIRQCYKIYKECSKMLEKRCWDKDLYKQHFESGVNIGVGGFNLMISLLPSRIMKLLEFVGFSGNQTLGLEELRKGSKLKTSLRGPLCCIVLLGYHTVVTYVLGMANGDIELSTRLCKQCLEQFPKGAIFLFFDGRIEEIKGHIDEAILKFEETIDTQSEWRQFHHLCYWELMWCHAFKCDWLMAMKYAERLSKESRWSRSTYMYQKASFLIMCDNHSQDTKQHLMYLLKEVPNEKQRIAGKSIPFEKFTVSKAARYFEQGEYLTLPGVEVIYLWNGFNILSKKRSLLEAMLLIVEQTVTFIQQKKETFKNYYDNYSLAILLKGVCLRHRGQALQAEWCFLEVINHEKEIKFDTYLVPYATVELAILSLDQNKLQNVKKFLHAAKKDYKGYALESRLHFRIHAIQLQLDWHLNDEISKATSLTDYNPPIPTPVVNDKPPPVAVVKELPKPVAVKTKTSQSTSVDPPRS